MRRAVTAKVELQKLSRDGEGGPVSDLVIDDSSEEGGNKDVEHELKEKIEAERQKLQEDKMQEAHEAGRKAFDENGH